MSPEMVRREKYSDKIDVWAIGVLTFTLIYGVPPFDVEEEEELDEEEESKIIFVCILPYTNLVPHFTDS